MKQFMDKDFLLKTETARTLYHEIAADLPICDFHCHIPAQQIAENKPFTSITEVWLGGDHYKWRAERIAGVPEEKIGRIFDRFYRCDEARTKKGSGVGLYVVKYIMEEHGGSVEAVNDGGLKLILRFPRADKNM